MVHESASVMGPLVLTSVNVSNVSIRAYLTIMEGRYGAVRGMVQVPDPYNTRTRVRIWPYRTVHRAFVRRPRAKECDARYDKAVITYVRTHIIRVGGHLHST